MGWMEASPFFAASVRHVNLSRPSRHCDATQHALGIAGERRGRRASMHIVICGSGSGEEGAMMVDSLIS